MYFKPTSNSPDFFVSQLHENYWMMVDLGAFTNYVDMFWAVFDHLTTLRRKQFFVLLVNKTTIKLRVLTRPVL